VISLVLVIGAAMAGLAGVLVTMNYGTFDFYIGFIIGIKAFTAAVLGGSARYPARCSAVYCWGWPKRSSPGW
jgi:branched-chain amino acid transport system permease protein